MICQGPERCSQHPSCDPGGRGGSSGGGLTSSVVCTILSTEEKYASHRNWVCCWKASTRSRWMQRTAEGICGGRGVAGFSLQPPPGSPAGFPCLHDLRAIPRDTAWPRMLCHRPAAALPSPLPGAGSSPGPPRVLSTPPRTNNAPEVRLGWDPSSRLGETPLHPPTGGLPGSTAEVSPQSLTGGCTTTGVITGGSLVCGVGQDPAAVPAAAASHCPRQRLCPSRWPRRRAAPSRRSAAQGCRRPAVGPHTGWDRAPGPRSGVPHSPHPPHTCSASRKRKEPKRLPRGTMQKVELCSSSW